jgi:hypothetical protein
MLEAFLLALPGLPCLGPAPLIPPPQTPSQQIEEINEPVFPPGFRQETWACESEVIYQGICPDDHLGLSVDAGGDWNGDGRPDVILGGGAKVDFEGQDTRVDDYANPASIYLGGLGTDTVTIPCTEEGVDDLDQPLQFPDVRLIGTHPPSLDWTMTGSQTRSEMGFSLARGGNFNADGIPDIAVGARKFTRSGELPICSCSTARPSTAGRIQLLSSIQLTLSPRSRLLANFFGETKRDRLGFSCAFLGATPGHAGDAVVGGALAWPNDPVPDALAFDGDAALCTDCPDAASCPPIIEVGRAYLLRAEPAQ